MVATNEYTIIAFYTIFIILLNLLTGFYGETFIQNADFVNADIKKDFSGDIFATLSFLLFANVPETSNISNAILIYRLVYIVIIVPYTILIAFIIGRLIIPWGM